MKIEVYTSIFGDKDKERSDIRVFSAYNKFTSPVMNAKIYKVLSHKFLEADVTIWVDGNIFLEKTPQELVDMWLGDADMAFFRHYKGQNFDGELKLIKYSWRRRDRVVYDEVMKQVEYYEKIDDPHKYEMAMGGFIIRRHSPLVEQFNEAWWAEICRWSQRDQISLPRILKKFPELKINIINENMLKNSYIRYEQHNHFLS